MRKAALFVAPLVVGAALGLAALVSSCGDASEPANLLTNAEPATTGANGKPTQLFENTRYIMAGDDLAVDSSAVISGVCAEEAQDAGGPAPAGADPAPCAKLHFHFYRGDYVSLGGDGVHQTDQANYSRYKLDNGWVLEHWSSGKDFSSYHIV